MTDIPASVRSDIPQLPVVEPLNPSYSDTLRANAEKVRTEAVRAGIELRGEHAAAVIQSTNRAAEPGGEPFSAANILSGDKPAETIVAPTPAETPAPAVEVLVEPGLEPREQSLIELELSARTGVNPGLTETPAVELPSTGNEILAAVKKDQLINPLDPEPEHHKWLRWKNKKPQETQPAQSASPTNTPLTVSGAK